MTIRRRAKRIALLAAVSALTLLGSFPGLSAADADADAGVEVQASSEALPIGDSDLPETRETRTLATGVTLTSIARGDEPADEDEIPTTTRGPWLVQVLTIDPAIARGHVAATYGPDLGQGETTSDLADHAGAVAAMNASYFHIGSELFPGEPSGTGIYRGRLLSEPGRTRPPEQAFLVDANTAETKISRLSWSSTVTNKSTGHTATVEYVNHPPVVPAACADLPDQSTCREPGDISSFTPEFGTTTPSGHGIEVVVDSRDCVVRVADTRGTALLSGQTSLQATGQDVKTLRLAAGAGCVKEQEDLTDEDNEAVGLKSGTFGVTGRYRLIVDGAIVAPGVIDDFTDRNPRSAAGTTADGKIILFTVDGRQTISVGSTLMETAKIAESLGMTQAVNLDGGGSTTMVADDQVVNSVSGPSERKVGDALVYVEHPYRRGR